MFTLLVILIVVGVVAVVVVRAVSAGRNPRPPAADQPTIVRPGAPASGGDRTATGRDDEPIPGSAEDRHRHGKP